MNWISPNWTSPGILTALWILPVFAWLLWRQYRQQRRREEIFLQSPMSSRLFPQASARRAFWRGALFLTGFAMVITALAGPRFGVYFEKVTRRGADILILLDTSRSMLAEDLAPNRLEAAKLDIEDLLSVVAGDRVGLIAFAGKPVIKVPLTTDFGFFRETLKGLDTHAAPMGGTAIGDAIRLALRAMSPDAARDQAILLITDGEDHESMPIEAAQSAAERGVRIYTVAVGDTKEGARIPLFDKNGKRTGFEQYEGQEVWSKADVDLLARLAETANGAFLNAGTGPRDLGEFYLSAFEDLNRSGYGESQQRLLHERYQLFLALGLAALTLWLAIPAAARPRWEEEIQPAAGGSILRGPMILVFCLALVSSTGIAAADSGISTSEPADSSEEEPELLRPEAIMEDAPTDDLGIDSLPADNLPADNVPADNLPKKEKKLSPRERYRDACAKRDDPATSAEAEEIFDKLFRGNEDKRLTPLCAYNLALIKARRLTEMAEAANADEPAGKDDAQQTDTKQIDAQQTEIPISGTRQPPQKDPVTLYREGYDARQRKRQEVRHKTDEAIELFREADDPEDNRLHQEVMGNIDLLRSWLSGQEKRWSDVERQKRLALGLPAHLTWLAGELDALLDDPSLAKDPATSKEYQGLYDLVNRMEDSRGDLRELADSSEARAAIELEKSEEPELDPQTASAAAEALSRAEDDARRFARVDARDAVRLGAEKIDEGINTLMDYRSVLADALARQEKIVERGKALAEKTADDVTSAASDEAVGALCWEDDFARRKVERLMSDAVAEFERRPWTDEEEQAGKEPQEETAGEETAGEETAGEETAVEQTAVDKEPGLIGGGESQEEAKLRRSMKSALDLGPEVGEILASLPTTAGELPAVCAGEERILAILREIQRPFQDNQDQNNQNDQNNDGQNNQNNNNQDNQDNQDKNNNTQDNQNQQNRDNQNNQNQENRDDSGQNADSRDKLDERQAEAAMRKVHQRQQQAEQMRRLRDEYQRRVDKPEKDW